MTTGHWSWARPPIVKLFTINHFESLEGEGARARARAHRVPGERLGELESAAIARLATGGGEESPPASPHGLRGASVAEHVRSDLISQRSLSGAGARAAAKPGQ